MTAFDPRILPADLPVPEDDGAADHLPGRELPALSLPSTAGPVDLRGAAAGTLVLYIYPRTGRPGEPPPDGWDATPGARGCTPQSCAFRDHRAELAALGADVVGMSAQTLADQAEFAAREHIPYPLIADPGSRARGGARSADVRDRRDAPLPPDHDRRPSRADRARLLSGLPARSERRRRRRVAQPGSTSRSLTAYIAAWVRSVTSSFRRTAETCVFTVFSDR